MRGAFALFLCRPRQIRPSLLILAAHYARRDEDRRTASALFYVSGFSQKLFNPNKHAEHLWSLITYKGSDILYESHALKTIHRQISRDLPKAVRS